MKFRFVAALLAGLVGCAAAACAPAADLTKLEIADTFTGWYDFGVSNGLNKLVPSLSFRLKNNGSVPVDSVQLTISFWQEGADGEQDSTEVKGIGAEAIAPGASGEPILVRSTVGYTTEGARADIFTNPEFKDWIVKIFAKRGGKIVPIGELKIERRIIPQAASAQP